MLEAQLWVARAYLHGRGVPPSRSEAFRWLESAAGGGLVAAQSQLAALHLAGLDAAASTFALAAPRTAPSSGINFDEAARWATRAMEAGCEEAAAILGYLLVNGPEAMRDHALSDQLYRKSAEAGSPQGALGYGLALLREPRDDADRLAAAGWIRKAADAGHAMALYFYGVMLEHGMGVAPDSAAAASYYRRCAERGVRLGQFRWGMALREGWGVERDVAASESWLRRAALAGEAGAAAAVGDFYAQDGDLPPNYSEAILWLPARPPSGTWRRAGSWPRCTCPAARGWAAIRSRPRVGCATPRRWAMNRPMPISPTW